MALSGSEARIWAVSLRVLRSLVLAALLVARVVSMVTLAPSRRDAVRRH